VGGTAEDNRLFIEAMLYRYGETAVGVCADADFIANWKSVHQRFSRWAKSGVLDRFQDVA
jgi:hypothetical protein